ncbi:MAG: ATP-dependent RNA helicase dbp6 [Geoglossum simile]|nr:MAG: ATP-dependent RNA helicase dbp6 [Geoglossum simile]
MASSFYTRYIPPEPSPVTTGGGVQLSKRKRKSGDMESLQAAPHGEAPPAKPKKQKIGVGNERGVPAAIGAQDTENVEVEANKQERKQRKKSVADKMGASEAKPGRGESKNMVDPEKGQEATPKESVKARKRRLEKVDMAPDNPIGRRGDARGIEAKAEMLGRAGEVENKLKVKKGTYHDRREIGGENAFGTAKRDKSKVREGGTPTKPKRGKKGRAGFVKDGDAIKDHSDDNPGTNPNPVDTKPTEQQTPNKEGKWGKRNARDQGFPSEGDESGEEMEGDTKYKSILSKFQRSTQISGKLAKGSSSEPNHGLRDKEPFGSQGLVPLPQPEEPPDSTSKPAFSALPLWLARPITVSPDSTTPFRDLPINAKLISSLELKGYRDAFAIQSIVLPMLLPGPTQHTGDLCISAATGSGKTLAYVLPMVESLRSRTFTRLRGLVVVPTRELVTQVKGVCELCSTGSSLSIGVAVGSRPLKAERDSLIKRGQKYDPKAYREMQEIAIDTDNEVDYDFYDEFDPEGDFVALPEHVPNYTSKVDILICTPGRLVDHIRSTPGFTLEDLQWLVIDEADRLLDQSFQEWVDVVLKALENTKEYGQMKAHEQILIDMGLHPPKTNTRKIVLSATMTRDAGKLSLLRLRKPNLVVVDDHGSTRSRPGVEGDEEGGSQEEAEQADAFGLPSTLKEWAVAAGDGNEKPLYLLQLLQTKILDSIGSDNDISKAMSKRPSSLDGKSEMAFSVGLVSDIDNESVSSHNSSTTSTSADDSSPTDDSEPESPSSSNQAKSPPAIGYSKARNGGGVLIFTKSNESAIRLSRLLSLLHPPLASRIGTLTGSIPSATRRKMLAAFRANKLPVLLASDLVARGLDVENVTYIVNYDLPKSIKGYVHRVGRTARAGRKGEAWTLVTQKEARWFWNEIGNGTGIRRNGGKKVARVRLDIDALGLGGQKRYEEALGTLKSEVRGDV